MAKQFEYNLSDTVNDVVACDQMRAEVEASVTIVTPLEDDPIGLICTKTIVQFNFLADLSLAEQTELNNLVQAHTGVGLPSPNPLENVTVATLPTYNLNLGDSVYVTDGVSGPGPAYYDGVDWRWYFDKSIVV